jgi:hypothetical protein
MRGRGKDDGAASKGPGGRPARSPRLLVGPQARTQHLLPLMHARTRSPNAPTRAGLDTPTRVPRARGGRSPMPFRRPWPWRRWPTKSTTPPPTQTSQRVRLARLRRTAAPCSPTCGPCARAPCCHVPLPWVPRGLGCALDERGSGAQAHARLAIPVPPSRPKPPATPRPRAPPRCGRTGSHFFCEVSAAATARGGACVRVRVRVPCTAGRGGGGAGCSPCAFRQGPPPSSATLPAGVGRGAHRPVGP